MKIFYTLIILFFLSSCAGPTSPFGSNVFITNSYDLSDVENTKQNKKVKIDSYPRNLLYHTNFDLKVSIKNEDGFESNFRYEIIYNGKKLQRWWESESITLSEDKKLATISFSKISLLPGLKNEITFLYYPHKKSKPVAYNFKGPECTLQDNTLITNLGDFTTDVKLKKYINTISHQYKINPILLASLVAQESSFNHKAVSVSRAIGLTQVTPIASKDISLQKKEWVTYPTSDKLSYLKLKYKVFRGDINSKNDWRLDRYKSLEGGAIFLKQLSNYWESKKSTRFLNKHFKSIPKTDIILASYNSGANRVRRNIGKHKANWIWSKELNEARKYVMNIKSYCHQFKN